jgi:hypothetical protein
MQKGNEEGRGGAKDDDIHVTLGELHIHLPILCAKEGWTKELDINSEPKHLGKRMFHNFFANFHGIDVKDEYLEQIGQIVASASSAMQRPRCV